MDWAASLKNGSHSALSYTRNTLETYYHSIPGNNLREKTTTVALKALATVALLSIAFVFYPRVTKKIRPGSLSWLAFNFIPLIGPSFLCVNYQKTFVDAIKTWKGHSSWSQRLIATAVIYVSFDLMTRTALALSSSISVSPKEPEQRTYLPFNHSETNIEDLADLPSLLQILDDSGLTNSDYATLGSLFKSAKESPPSLKERVAFHLSNQGLCNSNDLLEWGLVSPTLGRQAIMQNLLNYLRTDRSKREKPTNSASSRTIEKTQRVAAATFNLLLTGGTLALQLKYNFQSTLAGVGIGVLLKDYYFSYLFEQPKGNPSDKKSKNEIMLELADLDLISRRSQKTALTAPTTTVHKCRQIWESWHLLAHSIVPTAGPLSVIGGIVQGQTLASYWKSLYGKRVAPSPN